MSVKDFVFETFIRLTSRTCPHGFEDQLIEDVMSNLLPNNIEKDQFGNYFYKIGDSNTIFASHLDTVSKEYKKVNHLLDDNLIKTDGKTTLGADDKAGMTIMLWMIKNEVPGLYYFFVGEEVGCIGSGLASKYLNLGDNYDKIISFDRRGTGSVITHQSYSRSCSDGFANDLCSELNKNGLSYTKDDGGVYTDSAEFMDSISECTNISVGYYKEHTNGEYQDIDHLTKLADACLLVDWENLSVIRDFKIRESKPYSYGGWGNWDDFYRDDPKPKKRRKRRKNKNNSKPRAFIDDGSGGLEEIFDELLQKQDDYIWIINKFDGDVITWSDLEVIKDCYLQMDDEGDVIFYEFLKSQLVDV